MTVNAHFDGRSLVPDEPLDLPRNQRVIVHIERVTGPSELVTEPTLEWLAANAVEDDDLPSDLADQHDHYLYGRLTKDE